MKKLILFLAILPSLVFGQAADSLILTQRNPGGTGNEQRNVAIGTAGYALLSNGAGLAPSFQAIGSANAVTAASTAASAGLFWISNGADRSAVATDTVGTANITNTNTETFVILDNVDQTFGVSFVIASDITASNKTFTLTTGNQNTSMSVNGTTGQYLRFTGTGAVAPATVVEKIAVFSVSGGGSAITTGTINGTSMTDGPYTLTGYSISATGATGTTTVTFWAKAYSTAIPTVANIINTSGVSLTTGTSVYSTTLTDFTDTTFAAQDQFRCAVTAVDGSATDLTVTLYGTRL